MQILQDVKPNPMAIDYHYFKQTGVNFNQH